MHFEREPAFLNFIWRNVEGTLPFQIPVNPLYLDCHGFKLHFYRSIVRVCKVCLYILLWILLQESTESKMNSNVSEQFTVSITLKTKVEFRLKLYQWNVMRLWDLQDDKNFIH